MEAVFWSSEIVFFNEYFILVKGKGFWLITNFELLFRAFFLLVNTIPEIKCKPIFEEEHYSCSLKPVSWIFADILANGRRNFPASGNRVFIKFFITTSAYRFWVNFKPFACIQSLFFCCWKALLYLGVNQFSSTCQFLTVKAVFPAIINGFSIEWYLSWRVKTDFLSSVFLFRANFVLVESIIQIKVKLFLIE